LSPIAANLSIVEIEPELPSALRRRLHRMRSVTMKALQLTLDMTVEVEFQKATRRRSLQIYLLALATRRKVLLASHLNGDLVPNSLASRKLFRGEFWEGQLAWARDSDNRCCLYRVEGELAFEPTAGTRFGRLSELSGRLTDVVVGFRRHGDAPLIIPTRCDLIEGNVSNCFWDKKFDDGE